MKIRTIACSIILMIFLLDYASASVLVYPQVINHTKGENGADFSVHICEWKYRIRCLRENTTNCIRCSKRSIKEDDCIRGYYTGISDINSTITNIGNVTLTNIKVFRGGKLLQTIPELKVGDKEQLRDVYNISTKRTEFNLTFPPGACRGNISIVCDQGVEKEIILSHVEHYTLCGFMVWPELTLLGILLSILGFVGGTVTRKKKKQLILCGIIFFMGVLSLIFSSSMCTFG